VIVLFSLKNSSTLSWNFTVFSPTFMGYQGKEDPPATDFFTKNPPSSVFSANSSLLSYSVSVHPRLSLATTTFPIKEINQPFLGPRRLLTVPLYTACRDLDLQNLTMLLDHKNHSFTQARLS